MNFLGIDKIVFHMIKSFWRKLFQLKNNDKEIIEKTFNKRKCQKLKKIKNKFENIFMFLW